MPSISKRGLKVQASPIRKLVPFAEQAKREGKQVYHLNIGQPDIVTPEIALQAVKNYDVKTIAYSHSAGNESYRRALTKYYNSLGINITHEEMIITTGGSEAILFGFLSCLNPGEEVIIPEPFYTNYNGFASAAGITVKAITSSIENGFALPAIEEFDKIITPKTKAIMICNPNNPTGYLYSKKEILALGEIVKKYDLFLFADEVYREFVYDGEEHYSVMNLKDIEQNIILMDSVSKRYSACGVRIGALISKNKEIIATAMKFAQARLSPPSYGQVLGEAALKTPKEYFDKVYNEYIARRDFLIRELNKIEGVMAPTPKGAFYTVVQLPIDDSDKFAQWLLTDFSYKNSTVMVAPATGFYATPGLGKKEVRIAYVLKIEDLKKSVEILRKALEIYPGRTK